jgi:hypothetical protein
VREWKVTAVRLPCGHAFGCWVQPGEQYCLLKGDGWITAKVRCQAHAGSEPPEIIEDRKIAGAVFEERELAGAGSLGGVAVCGDTKPMTVPAGFASVKHLAQAAETDWARKAANDVDDGE